MPRKTLPQSMRNLNVFDTIEITKDTDEDVWNFYKEFCDNFDAQVDYFKSALNEAAKEIFEGNPFSNRSIDAWRKKRVQLFWKDNSLDWLIDLGEQKVELYNKLNSLYSDLIMCNKELNWDKDETKQNDYYEWINKSEYFSSMFKDKIEEIKIYEKLRFNEAKKQYEEEDKEYIKENSLRIAHQYHKPKEYYHQYLVLDNKTLKELNKETDDFSQCKYCIAEEEQKKMKEEHQKELEEAQLKQNEDYIRHLLEVQAEERKKWLDNRKEYFCELCNFKSYSATNYEAHCNTREHSKKKHNTEWYCKTCNYHARSDNEITHHNRSKKHLKAIGDIVEDDVEIFECKICNYTTTRKDHYNLHNKTKKHLDKQNLSQ